MAGEGVWGRALAYLVMFLSEGSDMNLNGIICTENLLFLYH